MKIAGLDVGTTGCKLTVFDENGRRLARAYRDYPSRRMGETVIDASAISDAVFGVIGEIAKEHPDLSGIGVTSFGETFVLTDGDGRPLCESMLYTDPRGAEECADLCRILGEKRITETTGLFPHSMYSLPKLMWIKKHRPDVFRAAKHCFLMEDYVVYLLTGRAVTEYSLASRTMAFDIRKCRFDGELLSAAGIDPSIMPEPILTGTPAGKIRPGITELFPDTVIVPAGHDQIAAAVGAGAFDSSVAVDGAGTVQCLTPVYDSLPNIEVMAKGYFSVVPYVIPGKYVAYAFSYTGGELVRWCAETLGEGKTIESLDAAFAGDGPTGLLVLPHFAGAATPYMDSGSKGAIVGLTAATTLPEIFRACREGVVYEMKLNLEAMKGSGISFEKLRATGGGAKSSVWMQMKADVLGLPVTTLDIPDAGTVGSAMQTGVAAGVFDSLSHAAGIMVRETGTYYPRREMTEKYCEVYERYRRLYSAVRPLV